MICLKTILLYSDINNKLIQICPKEYYSINEYHLHKCWIRLNIKI